MIHNFMHCLIFKLFKYTDALIFTDAEDVERFSQIRYELCCKTAETSITRKRFSEKPIVAFTNSTVFNFILDFYMYD